jgi:Tfp pilus assembly protein PilF
MLVGLGAAWYVHGSYELAAQRLCEASDIDPRNPIPYSFLLKMIEAERTESSGIAERFQRFATLEPNNAKANYYYAVSLWKQRTRPEDHEIAAKVKTLLERAVLLDPKFAEAYLQLGIVQTEWKDYGKAVATYSRAIELDPGMELAHFRLAQAYRLSGQSEKAADEVKRYEELSKKHSAESDRERGEVKRFIYTLREDNRGPQP